VTLTDLVRAVGRAVGRPVRILHFPFYRLAWLASAGIERAFKAAGSTPPVFRRRLSWFVTNRQFRIDRARQEPGYRPRVSLREGLARTAAWYRELGYLPPAPAPAAPERGRTPAGAPRAAGAPGRRPSHPGTAGPTSR
jgi:nucleoside-diphosphate-sugar epimerase